MREGDKKNPPILWRKPPMTFYMLDIKKNSKGVKSQKKKAVF
jgi:hypothetical protein